MDLVVRVPRCDDLQIIAIHDYNLDPSYVGSGIDAAKPSVLSSGKRLLYEEFGAEGSSKQSQIEAVTNILISVSFVLRSCRTLSSADIFGV